MQTRLVLLLAFSIIVRNVCIIYGFEIRTITYPINMLLCFAPIFVQLFVVPAMIPPNPAECGLIRTNVSIRGSSESDRATEDKNDEQTPPRMRSYEKSEVTLHDILRNPTSLHLFMTFLSKQLSVHLHLSVLFRMERSHCSHVLVCTRFSQ